MAKEQANSLMARGALHAITNVPGLFSSMVSSASSAAVGPGTASGAVANAGQVV